MDAVEDIKARLSIEDVIGEYVQLKRSGRNWRGLSPFTNEKTPSFMVSPEKQIWHDFSSGKGGNMFSFVWKWRVWIFAAHWSHCPQGRNRSGPIPDFVSEFEQRQAKTKNLRITGISCEFYQVQFSKNRIVLEYVLK